MDYVYFESSKSIDELPARHIGVLCKVKSFSCFIRKYKDKNGIVYKYGQIMIPIYELSKRIDISYVTLLKYVNSFIEHGLIYKNGDKLFFHKKDYSETLKLNRSEVLNMEPKKLGLCIKYKYYRDNGVKDRKACHYLGVNRQTMHRHLNKLIVK